MKKLVCCFICLVLIQISFGEDFIREFPKKQIQKLLTPERFKNQDAVIVLKEQSYKIENDEVYYRGVELNGLNTTYTKILIAKLFNESAVKRYGSFDYTYFEQYGDEISNGFDVRCRILKADDEIWEMEEDEVQRIISREASDGRPLNRKVLFKIPNLEVGDILQIEYSFTRILAYSTSNMFYYNDRDFVLFSNLYITLPSDMETSYLNFSEDQIGKPRIEQMSGSFGSGKTYFWGLKNLQPIPDEPFSRPFTDRSLMTAFVVEKYGRKEMGNWFKIAEDFYDNYLDEDDIDNSQISFLEMNPQIEKSKISMDIANELYSNIRKKLKLDSYNSLIPLSDDIDSIFEKCEGDASDLAYIMYKILKQWGINVNIVCIRDHREGIYEKTVPTTRWFDRLGVLVNIDGREQLFDFDRCISKQYSMPWFLKEQDILVIMQENFKHKRIGYKSHYNDNEIIEKHIITFDETFNVKDDINLKYEGAPAEKIRENFYDLQKSRTFDKLRNIARKNCLQNVDSVIINDFLSEPVINIDCSGNSSANAEQVESYLTLKLKNHTITEFYNKIYSTTRRNDYFFNGPFKMQIFWEVNIPEGYLLHEGYGNLSFPQLNNISAKITRSNFSQKYSVTATIKFPSKYLSYKDHSKLLSLIENVNKELSRDIILKKI